MSLQTLEQAQLFAPSPKNVRVGHRLYFQYTTETWMPAIVKFVQRQGAVIEPEFGTIRRTFALSWDALRWSAGSFNPPDRPTKGRRGKSRSRSLSPQPVVVETHPQGSIFDDRGERVRYRRGNYFA